MSVQAEEIRRARQATPFRPFTIHLADGRAFEVPHPEFAWITPTGRTIAVAEEDGVELIDGMLVTSLTFRERGASD